MLGLIDTSNWDQTTWVAFWGFATTVMVTFITILSNICLNIISVKREDKKLLAQNRAQIRKVASQDVENLLNLDDDQKVHEAISKAYEQNQRDLEELLKKPNLTPFEEEEIIYLHHKQYALNNAMYYFIGKNLR